MPSEIKKKTHMNEFNKLQVSGKDLERKILAFVYAY